MKKQAREIARGPNLVPTNAIRFTDAYHRLLTELENQTISLPPFEPYWIEAFENSRVLDEEVHDTDVYNNDIKEFFLNARQANVFLREQIEDGKLEACVQDPETGEIYKLAPSDWTKDWSAFVPVEIFNDYIDSESYDSPGPEGSEIRNALRPVFFLENNFQSWLSSITKDPLQRAGDVRIRKDHIVQFAAEMILKIWVSPPRGVAIKEIHRRVNEELVKQQRKPISLMTIRRARALSVAQKS